MKRKIKLGELDNGTRVMLPADNQWRDAYGVGTVVKQRLGGDLRIGVKWDSRHYVLEYGYFDEFEFAGNHDTHSNC